MVEPFLALPDVAHSDFRTMAEFSQLEGDSDVRRILKRLTHKLVVEPTIRNPFPLYRLDWTVV